MDVNDLGKTVAPNGRRMPFEPFAQRFERAR
jgi:hypothetical protein